jgi:hypothetical protein
MAAAAAFRADLRHLDTWMRANLPSDAANWFNMRFQPLTEMINVLFMNKALLRRPEIRQELCSSLTSAQLCQLLSSCDVLSLFCLCLFILLFRYEPQRGEEPVPLSLIQSLMPTEPRSHQAEVSSVLVDVANLDPIDLSVLKDCWMMTMTMKQFKEHSLPVDVFEEFIRFRDQSQAKIMKSAAASK